MKTQLAAVAWLAISMSAPASAETRTSNWQVSEGAAGATKGVWTMTFDHHTLAGQAQMTTLTNQPLGYKVQGVVDKHEFTLTRTSSSDNVLCNYTGKFNATRTMILGMANCGDTQTVWVAIPAVGQGAEMKKAANGNAVSSPEN